MKSRPSYRTIPAATHAHCLLLGCCALAAVTLQVHAETYIWAQDDTSPAGGNWNLTTTAGWVSAGTYPHAADDIATVNKNISANKTITINVNNAKCGELFLSDNQATTTAHWNIGTDANNYALTFEVTSGKALLNIGRAANGAVQFAAPIKLNSDLQIKVQATSPGLSITKTISDGTGSHGIEKIDADVLILGAVNTYSGNTTITAGTLRPTVADAIPYGTGKGNVIINGGTLDIRANAALNGLSGVGGTVDIVAGGGARALTVGYNDQSSTYRGAITNTTGTLSLIKTGTGTQTLSGVNTYTGGTAISAGTLALGASGTLSGTSGIEVVSPGVFDASALAGGFTLTGSAKWLGGTGTVRGDLTVAGSASLSPGRKTGATAGTLTVDGNLTLASDALLVFELGASQDQTIVTGELAVGAGALGFANCRFVGGTGFGPRQTYVLIDAAAVTGALKDGDTVGLVAGLWCALTVADNDLMLQTISSQGSGTVIMVR